MPRLGLLGPMTRKEFKMNNDNLKNSLASFIAWRKAQPWRATVQTRAGMLAHCGKSWSIAPDHKSAYFHEVRDFAAPVWDSKADGGRCTGYFADNFQNDCVRWAVVKIAPANKKRGRDALYAPVVYLDECEGVTMHLDCAGSQEEAQRWGESCAEKLAESCREDNAKDQAEQQIETARQVIHSMNVKALALIRAIRESDRTFAPPICEALRENLRGYLATRTEQFNRIAALQDDYWQAVS
jgi:hypothetical protein